MLAKTKARDFGGAELTEEVSEASPSPRIVAHVIFMPAAIFAFGGVLMVALMCHVNFPIVLLHIIACLPCWWEIPPLYRCWRLLQNPFTGRHYFGNRWDGQ